MVSLAGILNMDISYPGIQIKVELIVIREYLSQMETGINAVTDNYLRIEEGKVEGQEYHEYRHIYQIAEDEIPRIISLPFLVSIYTLFENSVTQLLKYAQDKEGSSTKFEQRKIKAKSLQSKFNKYMETSLSYDFQFEPVTMEKITEITKLRNCIAHANGNIEALKIDKAKEISVLEAKFDGIVVCSNQLDVSYEYLNDSMKTVAEAIESLMAYMEEKYGFS